MAFSFNFDVDIKTEEPNDTATDGKDNAQTKQDCSTDANCAVNDTTLGVKEAVEYVPESHTAFLEHVVCETLRVGTLPELLYLNETVLETTASEGSDSERILSQTAVLRSDLISGVYEGGLKIWECTYDLLEHIDSKGVEFAGKKVLDLGCGAGLLGITALKRGANEVHFQDYNSTVIERLTVPNVLLNCNDDDSEEEEDDDGGPLSKKKAIDPLQHPQFAKCRFFSGDWTSFLPLLLNSGAASSYDVILTSETIYNAAHYSALHGLLQKLLAPRGLVYLATKSHYFGVGGGLFLFQRFLEEKCVFDVRHVKTVELGLQRHVVALSFKERRD